MNTIFDKLCTQYNYVRSGSTCPTRKPVGLWERVQAMFGKKFYPTVWVEFLPVDKRDE